jgi:hypothetical protein
MCDRVSTWLKDAAVENGPIPLGALCPRNDAGGTLVRDSIPTGYKLMWRVPHSEEGSTLDQLTKRNRHFNEERGINSNVENAVTFAA